MCCLQWRIIGGSLLCCRTCERNKYDVQDVEAETVRLFESGRTTDRDSRFFQHPTDSQIALTSHAPLYPPGKIIHVVRSHPPEEGLCCDASEPIYQAIWAANTDFDEVLISPTMISDHWPDHVLDALNKVSKHISCSKHA